MHRKKFCIKKFRRQVLIKAVKIQVQGLVQGVGFRPFIYLLALKYHINGWIENRNDGVFIHAEGGEEDIDSFVKSILNEAPEASSVQDIIVIETSSENPVDFQIIKSQSISDEITEISPDIAVCSKCLIDLKNQKHRIDYPFINCTNCGPRFTIIYELPYDREKTSMAKFEMCEICHKEYTDIYDRRFHAQPVACNHCGPTYSLVSASNKITDFHLLLQECSSLIDNGEIIVIKGMGGYNISCDGRNETAVKKLRSLKKRENKPFAVMFRDIDSVRQYCHVNEIEEKALMSWRRPIVLLKNKQSLAFSVSNGLSSTGCMLPYLPFHYLLFEKLKTPVIVLTSGNFSDEPIIIKDPEAIEKFKGVTSGVVTHNREIVNRTDDSVVFEAGGEIRLIRRSRGYVPSPIRLKINVEGIFGAGAELTNCFCIGKGHQAILSQHIGDLQNFETYEFYLESIERYKKMFRFKPEIIVCDLHPDYLSTSFAEKSGLPVIKVQHHHAHIASVSGEYNLFEKVIGVAFDGVGLGTDGNIWGGEFFICDLFDFERVSHFEYIPVPGGDVAVNEPWRIAVSYLYKYFGNSLFDLKIPFIQNGDTEKFMQIIEMIDKKINCPLYASAGRLFDAVSSLLNICTIAGYHAEAPMRLESAISNHTDRKYHIETGNIISFASLFEQLISDLQKNIPVSVISTCFHNSIADLIFRTVKFLHQEYRIKKVVLSGGSFQNKYLLERTINELTKLKFDVYSPVKIPANDGGISLGQLIIAALKK